VSHLSGSERTRYVRKLFGGIANRYDCLNRLMTAGQDLRWRQEAVMMLEVQPGGRYLDAGAGTGDIALAVSRQAPGIFVVACDLTPEMIAVGRKRPGGKDVRWVIADAQKLPFAADVFNGVISGYLLRNVGSLQETLSEQHRVLLLAGRTVSLDTTPPRHNFLRPFIFFYLRSIIPLLGRLFARNSEAYRYLPQSTEQFLSAEKLAEKLDSIGFSAVFYVRRMAGTMAIHKAQK
jgi:demethylmenaquinone methyltransferase/2-methoxy-6-polyprenyl-1,4-benzoquinol methylase